MSQWTGKGWFESSELQWAPTLYTHEDITPAVINLETPPPVGAVYELPSFAALKRPDYVATGNPLLTLNAPFTAVPRTPVTTRGLLPNGLVATQGFTQNLLESTLGTPPQNPFVQTDWPNPLFRSRTLVPTLFRVDAFPGPPPGPFDWPNPQRRSTRQDWLNPATFALSVAPIPGSRQVDLPPATRAFPLDLRTVTQLAIGTLNRPIGAQALDVLVPRLTPNREVTSGFSPLLQAGVALPPGASIYDLARRAQQPNLGFAAGSTLFIPTIVSLPPGTAWFRLTPTTRFPLQGFLTAPPFPFLVGPTFPIPVTPSHIHDEMFLTVTVAAGIQINTRFPAIPINIRINS